MSDNHYWKRDEKRDYCSLVSSDKFLRAYVRRDGCTNLLFYNDERAFEHGEHDYDWHICEIDEAIARLQAIKNEATRYFAERGIHWPEE